MKQFFTFLLFCCAFFIFSSCDNSDNNSQSCNDKATVIADQPFNAIGTENYTITDVTLSGNCLSVTISSSGCSSNNWEMNLFGNDQQQLKLELINPELCLAVFQKTVSYSLVPLREEGQNQVTLTLTGWDEDIIYNY